MFIWLNLSAFFTILSNVPTVTNLTEPLEKSTKDLFSRRGSLLASHFKPQPRFSLCAMRFELCCAPLPDLMAKFIFVMKETRL
jgi:hypothetical protein